MIAWEPGARYAFTMVASDSPLASQMAEDYRLTAVPAGTRLDWTFAATPTTLGKLGMPVMKLIMRKMFRDAGDGLARYLATGGAS